MRLADWSVSYGVQEVGLAASLCQRFQTQGTASTMRASFIWELQFSSTNVCEGVSMFSLTDHCLVMAEGLAKLSEAMSHAVQGHPRWTGLSESSDKT